MRFAILLLALSAAFAADTDPAKILPTTPDRVQAMLDPTTGKVERFEIYDANTIVDSAGTSYSTPLRATVLTRTDAPALFAALDALLAKTAERDAAHRARKLAEVAEKAAAEATKAAKGK